MELTAILMLGGVALSRHLYLPKIAYRENYLQIAAEVAGPGRPNCTAHHPDGSEGPCFPHFSIRTSGKVNAWSHGGHIQFSSAAMTVLPPDQFALLAGHEIAHYYLGHNGSTAANELEADMLGAVLACRAGYRIDAALGLFDHAHGNGGYPAKAQRRKVVMDMAMANGCMLPDDPLPTLAQARWHN